MDGIVGSLRLGWNALLFKEDAYEEMRTSDSPVVKGLILIVIVGLAIAVFAFVGDVLEWATTPDLHEIKETVHYYLTQMPWWELAVEGDPSFPATFEEFYDMGWQIAFMASPNVGNAALNILLVPLGLIFRWLIYGVLAYLFARWLGGEGDFSQTLGVLALAVAPQALNVFTIIPYVQMGSVVSVWGILCAFVGLKKVHGFAWGRAVWATLLPFILAIAVAFAAACLASAGLAAVVGGLK